MTTDAGREVVFTGASGFDMVFGEKEVHLEPLPVILERLARESGAAPAVSFVGTTPGRTGRTAPKGHPVALTYAQLDDRARALARRIQEKCPADGRVAIMCPHDEHYIVAFLACLYAGVVAVPLHAPEFFRGQERLRAVLADSDPALAVTTTGAERSVRGLLSDAAPAAAVLTADTANTDGRRPLLRDPDHGADRIAYLQYTSGSTGEPAGVCITHGNLAATAWQLRSHFMPARTAVSWVPLFHDMGLICGIASPLSAGIHTVHLSPLQFIRDPFQWLKAISDHRADWSVAPNFALRHCVDRIDEERSRSLDLRSLRVLAIGGEMVRSETVAAFVDVFSSCGLAPGAPIPSYGLAEATLTVALAPRGEGTRARMFDRASLERGTAVELLDGKAGASSTGLVGCARLMEGVAVRIVSPETCTALPDGRVGEVWVRGPNCAQRYWRSPRDRSPRFDARIAFPEGEADTPWLRTGDSGFLHEGRLYLNGRIDDMFVVRGSNHFPEDIEASIESAVPTSRAAVLAFDPPAGEDEPRIVALVETDGPPPEPGSPEREEAVTAVRWVTHRDHGLALADVRIIRRGGLARTTSGKLRRQTCRERYLASAL